jgi:hypothetical protein
MQYALVNNNREVATPKAKGNCPSCGGDMVAKCGPKVIHHWAHVSRQCDPWWENETAWHREWKEQFPEGYREISHVAEDGEIHRADIKQPSGLVVEIQHSAMSDKERDAREAFYGNMLWIVDAAPFIKNLHICHPLPTPESDLAQDLRWFPAKNGMKGANRGQFTRVSKMKPGDTLVEIEPIDRIIDQIRANYRGHRQYYWIRPRTVWLTCKKPVYLDLGGRLMGQILYYGEQELPCIKLYLKNFLMNCLLQGVIPSD